MRTLMIGTNGLLARAVVDGLGTEGVAAAVSHRGSSPTGVEEIVIRGAADVSALLSSTEFDQVVSIARMDGPTATWSFDFIDGPRWLVVSSGRLASLLPRRGSDVAWANEGLAQARGATVIRPTMTFGHGLDQTITRVIRQVQRWRVPMVVGDGMRLIQPLHLDDLAPLVVAHRDGVRPEGRFAVAGPDAVHALEVLRLIGEITGSRAAPVAIGDRFVHLAARWAEMVGLDAEQLWRLTEERTADIDPTREAFGWNPAPFTQRLAQAVRESAEERSELLPTA